jgi:hypothetical protein
LGLQWKKKIYVLGTSSYLFQLNIYDSTGISLNPLIFFGEDFQLSDPDADMNVNVVIDNLINFKTSVSAAGDLEVHVLACCYFNSKNYTGDSQVIAGLSF